MSTDDRVRYWNEGAAIIRSLGGPHEYACPLCRRFFPLDRIECLSLDHVPPKSVGGKLKVLTCRRCDNTSGHELDAHAARFEQYRRIVAGEPYAPVPARLTIEGVTVNVELRSDHALHNDIRVLPGSNPPGASDKLAAVFMGQAGSGSEINLTLPLTVSERRAMVSYLRAGYLAAFAVLGYSAVARSSFERVRQQIREPDLEHTPHFFYRCDPPMEDPTVAAVDEPEWHRSIVVLMGRYRVSLPIGDDAGLYERLAKKAGARAKLRCRDLGWPTRPVYANDRRLAATARFT